ncbi:hypothetical protein PsorP6_008669 [Peronosclerospora sorghi]|uniref:Uncharacterized protein n=1 Tax=Peronosclerospora sorghi TaxID=230839 RepID=A0ACC0VZV2_9STRA|nr:hypothetical protein PsorP6_008669 [Peronosclerospora sorghi]
MFGSLALRRLPTLPTFGRLSGCFTSEMNAVELPLREVPQKPRDVDADMEATEDEKQLFLAISSPPKSALGALSGPNFAHTIHSRLWFPRCCILAPDLELEKPLHDMSGLKSETIALG